MGRTLTERERKARNDRIFRMARHLGVRVMGDPEVGRYSLAPEDLERLLMLAATGGNPFEQKGQDDDETP